MNMEEQRYFGEERIVYGMSINKMQMAAMLCFIVAGAFLFFSGILFFAWDIRRIVGDMTGINARKAIRQIREQNRGRQRRDEKEVFSWKNTEQLREETEMLAEKTMLLTREESFYLVEEQCFLASENTID